MNVSTSSGKLKQILLFGNLRLGIHANCSLTFAMIFSRLFVRILELSFDMGISMAEIDETKERLSYLKGFLTIIIGVMVVTIGGMMNLYLSDRIGVVFGLGIIVVVALVLTSMRLMMLIEKLLKRLGEL
jgi:hypothetical protein